MIDKKQRILELLEDGLIMLHIDSRHPEIQVPLYLKGDSHLCINLSYRFGIPDLTITDTEITVTLSFQQSPFKCSLPMGAIWGVSQPPKEGIELFFDSLPPELLVQMMEEQIKELTEQVRQSQASETVEDPPEEETEMERQHVSQEKPFHVVEPSRTRPNLRLVVDNTETATSPTPQSPNRSHLHVVPTPLPLKIVEKEETEDTEKTDETEDTD